MGSDDGERRERPGVIRDDECDRRTVTPHHVAPARSHLPGVALVESLEPCAGQPTHDLGCRVVRRGRSGHECGEVIDVRACVGGDHPTIIPAPDGRRSASSELRCRRSRISWTSAVTVLSAESPVGYRGEPPGMAARGDGSVRPGEQTRLPGRCDARRRKDDIRADDGAKAPQRRCHRPCHRGRADRASQDPMGGCRCSCAHPARSELPQQRRRTVAAVRRCGRHLRAGRREGVRAPPADGVGAHTGHPRRGAPRRRRAQLGRRRAGGVRASHQKTDAVRHAVPQR